MKLHPNVINLVGQQFGKLTVESCVGQTKNGYMWNCRCNCANRTVKPILGRSLKARLTVSCGCHKRELARKQGLANRKHGMTSTIEYRAYIHMLDRCYNTNNIKFNYHGGRGIKVCYRWRFGENGKSGFECFYEDMGPRPKGKSSLDRWPDNNGNYKKSNCRWATPRQQNSNKRNVNYVIINGRIRMLRQWCRKFELNHNAVYSYKQRHGVSAKTALLHYL